MTDTIHSCGPTCTSPACITARVPLLSGAQCMEFRRMNCSFDDMVRAIYAAGIQVGAQDHTELVKRLRHVGDDHIGEVCMVCHESAAALEGKHD